MGIASMDLSKAFDSVSHGLLLRKLKQKGLGQGSLKWLQSYLSSRTQQVRFKNFTSENAFTKSGVPQGSVLGPILFIALTADLIDHLGDDCIVKAYADDTQLLVSGRNRQEEVRRRNRESTGLVRQEQSFIKSNKNRDNDGG